GIPPPASAVRDGVRGGAGGGRPSHRRPHPRAQRGPRGVRRRAADVPRRCRVPGSFRPPRLAQRFRPRPRGGGPRPGPSFAGAGGEPRAAGRHSPVVPVGRPGGGRRRRLSFRAGLLGLLTACRLRPELDDRMFLMPAFVPLFRDKRTSNAVELGSRMPYICDMAQPDLTLVREFKRRAEEALPGRIARVMLYGSRARGDARADSDWDVAVFVKGSPTPQDRRALSDIGFDLMMESGQHFQTMVVDALRPVEHSSFLKNVYEDGIAA